MTYEELTAAQETAKRTTLKQEEYLALIAMALLDIAASLRAILFFRQEYQRPDSTRIAM